MVSSVLNTLIYDRIQNNEFDDNELDNEFIYRYINVIRKYRAQVQFNSELLMHQHRKIMTTSM
jgi:hypothetical protein